MRRSLSSIPFACLIGLLALPASLRAQDFPAGSWEVAIRGSDRGVAVITFHDDFTVSGYGITLKSAGLFQLSGDWRPGPLGEVVGTYLQEARGITAAGFFVATVASGQNLKARFTASNGRLVMAGHPLAEPLEVGGAWMAQFNRSREVALGTVSLSPRESFPGLFELVGEGFDSGGRFQITGFLLVTSGGAAGLFVETDLGGAGTKVESLIGRVSPNRLIARLKGKGPSGRVQVLAISQSS